MQRGKVLALILMLILPVLAGCGSSGEAAGGTVSLLVTKGFGTEDIFNGNIDLQSRQSVMELMKQHLDVETAYGGGFVNGINGLASGYTNAAAKEKLDWFYFVNGIMTSVGATDYYPTSAEVIWWDYHPWGQVPFTPAVIGAFPQPFTSGYQGYNPGTLILAGKGCDQLAAALGECLSAAGVAELDIKPYEESLAADRSRITLVVALWAELADSKFWTGIQENRDKTGWFAELAVDAFHGLNEEAGRKVTYENHVGAILATGMGLGDQTPLWLVTGLDEEGLSDAVDVLINHPEKISKHFGALVHEKEVLALPVTH